MTIRGSAILSDNGGARANTISCSQARKMEFDQPNLLGTSKIQNEYSQNFVYESDLAYKMGKSSFLSGLEKRLK